MTHRNEQPATTRVLVIEKEESAGYSKLDASLLGDDFDVMSSDRIPPGLGDFDVVVLNNLDLTPGKFIPPLQDTSLESFVKKGGGCVAIHDSLSPLVEDTSVLRLMGLQYAVGAFGPVEGPSGATLQLHLALGDPSDSMRWFPIRPYHDARDHPIVRDVGSFDIGDEYWALNTASDVTPLLYAEVGDRFYVASDRLRQETVIAGCRFLDRGRCAFALLGHFGSTYDQSSYRRVLRNSVHWTAKRLPAAFHRFDLFVSHSSYDAAQARNLSAAAELRGLRCFVASTHLEAGDEWSEEIRGALADSREMCILLSRAALKSEWVATEWGAAWAMKKRLTPILLDGIEHSAMPERLRERQTIGYADHADFLDGLARRVQDEN